MAALGGSRYHIPAAAGAADGSSLPTVEISVDGKTLATEVAAESVGATTDQLDAGRHVLRLTARSGETLVRSITVVPAPGRESMRQSEHGRSSLPCPPPAPRFRP